jgi:ABC-type transport system substrate-binding protein
MSKMAQSGFVMVSLGALVALSLFNAAQLHNLESVVIDNQKQLTELKKGVRVVGGSAGAARPGTTGVSGGYVASEQEVEALKDPANLLVPRPRDFVNAETVHYGGTFKRILGSDPMGLNPHIATGADNAEFNQYMGDYLAWPVFEDESQSTYFPMLATKITSPDDGKTYRIELRKGVLWHLPTVDWASGRYDWLKSDRPDGRHEFTADDYKFVYDMIENTQVAGRISSLRPYFDSLKEVRVIDRYTFEVEFTERIYTNFSIIIGINPSPRWLYMYDEDGNKFDEATWGLKVNEHWYNQKGIGTGPYRFVRWEPGVVLELEANLEYWGGRPSFDRVQMKRVADQNSWPRKLKAGEVDLTRLQPEQYATEIKGKQPGEYLGNEHIQFKMQDTLGYFYLGWNLDKPLFSDKRVRQALSMALNRFDIVDNVFHGLGEVTSGPFAHQVPCYDKSIEPLPFDLEASKALLEQAGWTDTDGDGIRDKVIDGQKTDFSFTFLIYGSSNEWATLAEVYREDLLSIGVKMVPSAVEWSTMLKKMEEREFDVYSGAWVLSMPTDLMQIWHSSEADKAKSSNRIGFRNKEADRIAEALRVTFDQDERTKLCHQFHAVVHEEQPYTFIYQRKRPVLYWDHLNEPEFEIQYPHRNLRHFSFRQEPARP